MSRIAPVTMALLADLRQATKVPPPTKKKAGDAQVLRIVEAEVKAMAAVARAAHRAVEAREDASARLPPDCWVILDRGVVPLARALSRLSRASGKGGGR